METIASQETAYKVFGKTRDELTAIIDKHTLTVQAWLSSRSPKAETFQGRGIRVSSTGFKIPLLNLALGCNFPPGTSEQEIEEEIETVKALFSRRNVPWYWWMNTSPTPQNIRSLLEKHGLEFDVEPLPAMAASLKGDPKYFPRYAGHIQVWQAKTIKDLQATSRIRRIAFKFREGEALTYFEDMPADWLENDSVNLFLAGESQSEPASIGALIFDEGIPGIYVMATLPDHHRKGYGKAILTRLLREASLGGNEIVALTASKAGFGLYSQFGFHHIFGFDFYFPPSQ